MLLHLVHADNSGIRVEVRGDPVFLPAEETTGSELLAAVPDTTQSLAELRIESSLKSETAHYLAGRCLRAKTAFCGPALGSEVDSFLDYWQ